MIIAKEKIIPYSLAGSVGLLVTVLVGLDVKSSFDEATQGQRAPLPPQAITATPPEGIVIPTDFAKGRHLIEAVLTGPNGRAITVPLILDTGATSIVLPSSMKARLGFNHNNLSTVKSHTAGGTVKSFKGRLASAAVGQGRVDELAIVFIDDSDFGRSDEGLLGMSFLRHFRLTVLTSPPRIILVPKRV